MLFGKNDSNFCWLSLISLIPVPGRTFEKFDLSPCLWLEVGDDFRNYNARCVSDAITCRKCGERVFTSIEDERIIASLRAQANLLSPQEIQDTGA